MEEEQFLSSDLAVQLSDVIATIINEKPDNALGLFESLATFNRTGKMVCDPEPSLYLGEDKISKAVVPPASFKDVSWAKNLCELVVPTKPPKKAPKEGEEEEEAEPEPEETEDKGELADIVAEQSTFNLLGIGLSESEAYRVTVSLKRMMDKENVKLVRFWGKVFALQGVYYISETEVDTDREPEEAEAEAEAEDEEGAGKGPETILNVLKTAPGATHVSLPTEPANQPGVNKFRYWVTTDLTKWTRLPDVKPAHIQAARRIKKLFTGDLAAPVLCHPPFPGSEQEYLRAQIARISHGCKIAPKGIYEPPPEDEPEEDAPPKTTFKIPPYETLPELTPVPTDDLPEADDEAWLKPGYATWGRGYQDDALLVVSNWVHTEAPLLQAQGRTTEHKFAREDGEEEEEEEGAAPKPPLELISPLCTGIEKDDCLECPQHSTPLQGSWSVRKAYSQPSLSATKSVLVRSLRWPGSYCYAQCLANKPGASFSNTYIGYGVKAGVTHAFSPPTPQVSTSDVQGSPAALLQTDYTPDDELQFSPPPPPPAVNAPEEEEEEAEED